MCVPLGVSQVCVVWQHGEVCAVPRRGARVPPLFIKSCMHRDPTPHSPHSESLSRVLSPLHPSEPFLCRPTLCELRVMRRAKARSKHLARPPVFSSAEPPPPLVHLVFLAALPGPFLLFLAAW